MATTREAAIEHLREVLDQFLAQLAVDDEAQWHHRPSEGEWSLADAAEHVAKSNRLMERVLARGLVPRDPGASRMDDSEIPTLLDRELGPAPPLSEPTGRWSTRRELLPALRDACEALLRATDGRTTEDLRSLGAPHPLFGPFDGMQWLLFAAVHTERHARDLAPIRQAAGLSPSA